MPRTVSGERDTPTKMKGDTHGGGFWATNNHLHARSKSSENLNIMPRLNLTDVNEFNKVKLSKSFENHNPN
jgi:hypothetical protein